MLHGSYHAFEFHAIENHHKNLQSLGSLLTTFNWSSSCHVVTWPRSTAVWQRYSLHVGHDCPNENIVIRIFCLDVMRHVHVEQQLAGHRIMHT
jgi:hypothetical protein